MTQTERIWSKRLSHRQQQFLFPHFRWLTKSRKVNGEKRRHLGATWKRHRARRNVPMWKVPRWEPEDIPHAHLTKSEKKKKPDRLPFPPPPVRLLWCAECNAFEHQQFRRSQRGARWIAVELVASRGCAGELGERGQSRLWSAGTRVESVGSRLIFTYVEGCKCANDEAAQHSRFYCSPAADEKQGFSSRLAQVESQRAGKRMWGTKILVWRTWHGILWLTCFMYPHMLVFCGFLKKYFLLLWIKVLNKLNCSMHLKKNKEMFQDTRVKLKGGWGNLRRCWRWQNQPTSVLTFEVRRNQHFESVLA